MPRPTIYFHGTSRVLTQELDAHRSALCAGDSKVDDPHLVPMPGRVYLTPDPSMAFRYMTLRQKWPNYRGTVLEVEPPPAGSYLIDEDCVGQALAIWFALQSPEREDFLKIADMVKSACGFGDSFWDPDHVAKQVPLLSKLSELAREVVPPKLFATIKKKNATVRVFANVGKVLSPHLGPELTQFFVAEGANLAVKEPVKPRGGWIFEGLPNVSGTGYPPKAFSFARFVPNAAGVKPKLERSKLE